jgi:hypothetical protein
MDEIGRILVKLTVALFSLLFVFPAIIFSVLVLGLTDSWKSGTVMLVSSLILILIVRINSENQPKPRRMKKYASNSWEMGPVTLSAFHNQNPPPLSDIYRDMELQHGEADVLCKLIVEAVPNHDTEIYPYYCSKCDRLESRCSCNENITTPY